MPPSAVPRRTRPPRRGRSARCSRSGPARPASPPRCSTAAGTPTTAGSRTSLRARAKAGWTYEHQPGHATTEEDTLMPPAQRRGGTGGGGERRDRRDDRRGGAAEKGTAYLERVVTINRVAKVVSGGRRFSFPALVVVGDGNGMVGVGYGNAKELPAAIARGAEAAKTSFFKVPRIGGTIPHTVTGEDTAGGGGVEAGEPRGRRGGRGGGG